MFLQYFKIKRNNYKNQTLSIYQEIVNHSNHFIKYSLNDKDYDFDEIFETFSIITVFYLKKLKDTNTQTNNEISQRIMDSFIKDLDQHFREKGIGDMSIGKYVKKYVKKFYYRLKTLDEVLKDNIDINFDNYIRKFGISNHGNIKKINEDLKNLYSEIVIDK
tara:strand:- start:2109 stop:2594 length:486 start_codon:yes stop_codon:yes gene_type:complete